MASPTENNRAKGLELSAPIFRIYPGILLPTSVSSHLVPSPQCPGQEEDLA